MRQVLGVSFALATILAFAGPARAEVRDGSVGSSCDVDTDCVDGLFCMTPEFSGMPGGTCTLPCSDHAECGRYSATAFCAGTCVERCEQAVSSGSELDDEKCHGRKDRACLPTTCADEGCSTIISTCLPFCAADEQCGEALYCAQGTPAVCAPMPPEGDLPGSFCDYSVPLPTCRGVCDVDIDSELIVQNQTGQVVSIGVCEEPCLLGGPETCTVAPSGAPRSCIGSLALTSGLGLASGTGDLGKCVTLCNCTSDCRDDEACLPYDLGDAYDAPGVCQHGYRLPSDPDCIAGAAGASSTDIDPPCRYGPVRACKENGCLGTAECLPDGTYGECNCLDGEGGEGGADHSVAPRTPNDDSSGCHVARGRSPSGLLAILGVFVLMLGRMRSPRRPAVRLPAQGTR